ncbi:tRNA (guanosine(37)-N1)-methyltransferase TrmD [Candidatus Sumerlaeota bacterium]|nr:tRNA (guanosine(37)-N1)-methyltransferase TrmD [Candidatus Sumerlaeota bacterium]
MRIDILTLFPEMFSGFLEHSIVGRAREAGRIDVRLVQWRDFATDKHRVVDDAPYGGGAGMVLMIEPLWRAIESLRPPGARPPETRVIYLTPQGVPFGQSTACDLARETQHLILVCGRYEGVDQRARDTLFDGEISVGDYVLTGGELPAAAVTDAVVRLLPGVLGNDQSAEHESFMDGVFDYPHYTRPEEFEGMKVPEILLSGHHARIEEWRRRQAIERTLRVRPELIDRADLTPAERACVEAIRREGEK